MKINTEDIRDILSPHLNRSKKDLNNTSYVLKKSFSSFYGNEKDVVDLIKTALIKNESEINSYLNNKKNTNDLEIICSFNDFKTNVTGRGYIRYRKGGWENGPISLNYFKITITKSAIENKYYIVDAFPVD